MHIREVAGKLSIPERMLKYYSRDKAKISLIFIENKKLKTNKLTLITAITLTASGKGKIHIYWSDRCFKSIG